MTQMLRFKVKTTPNKTTVRKVLQALFLQHFNGFILHGTFVCQEIYIIFSKIKVFPLEYSQAVQSRNSFDSVSGFLL